MAPDVWLDDLPQRRPRAADDDLSVLCAQAYPYLSDPAVRHQITRLSGHLAGISDGMRRKVIAYSLYVRQLDVIQAATTRDFCRDGCPRPPVGCCNANHFQILSLADVMVSRPSQTALELAHVIGILQRRETAFETQAGRSPVPGHCDCLADDGCTLRLFKSPRCVHYLCDGLGDSLTERFGPGTARFLDAMHATAVQTIATTADFTDPSTLSAAAVFFEA